MGAAGDMLMSALYELLDEEQKQEFLEKMNSMGLSGVKIAPQTGITCGICGTHMKVTVHGKEEHEHGHDHGGPHHHASPESIKDRISALDLPQEVKENALAVYRAIAAAESRAHGCPVEQVHFHEVGALDAIADVAGVCYAIYLLNPARIEASPVHVGSGTVRCAHGVMPVPAPATAELLSEAPIYGGGIRGELCTPTGAALLVHFAEHFGTMPLLRNTKTGIGIGTKEFEQANCVRIFLGESQETESTGNGRIAELVCNVDDMTPEALAFAAERLLEYGALDVYTTPGTMKKGRPGWVLTVLCGTDQIDGTARQILRETTTNGVRVRICEKYFLMPGKETVQTDLGTVRIKTAEGFGIRHEKPEYEDTALYARKAHLSYGEASGSVLARRREQENDGR